MLRTVVVMIILSGGIGAITFARQDPPPTSPTPPAPLQDPKATPPAGPFDAALLRIASEYRAYPRVSDRANWAPADCRVPPTTGVQKTRSPDSATHGRKLYFLYAKDAAAYDRMSSYGTLDFPCTKKEETKPWLNPVGQTVVKESFAPVEVQKADIPKPTPDPARVVQQQLPDRFVQDGEKYFKTGEATQLFIMTRMDQGTPDTDGGWVYGVVSADAKTVLSAGRIESCMECHRKTTRDRLYGHRWSWPLDRQGNMDWRKPGD